MRLRNVTIGAFIALLGCAGLYQAIGAATGISTQQIRTAQPIPIDLSGTSPADGGVSLAVAPADHNHQIAGVLPIGHGGTGANSGLQCSTGQVVSADGGSLGCVTFTLPAGSVNSNSPIIGNGTVGAPLTFDYSVPGTFLARQTFSGGMTATGSSSVNMSGSTGTFSTPTGAATYNGAFNSFINLAQFSSGLTLNGNEQFNSGSGISVGTGSSAAFDFSGSAGAFKTSTGAVMLGGSGGALTCNATSSTFTNSATFSSSIILNGASTFNAQASFNASQTLLNAGFTAGNLAIFSANAKFAGGVPSGSAPVWIVGQASAPSNGTAGTLYYDTTAPGLFLNNGTQWSKIPTQDSANTFTATQTFSSGIAVSGGTATLGVPLVINAGASASSSTAIDLSGSSGTFKTPTGVNTFGGSANGFTNGIVLGGGLLASGVSSSDFSGSTGSFKTSTGTNTLSGSSLKISSAQVTGRAVLVAGTKTVSSTAVTATSVIQLTNCVPSLTTMGLPTVGTIVAGTSFVINSIGLTGGAVVGTDTSTICWLVIN